MSNFLTKIKKVAHYKVVSLITEKRKKQKNAITGPTVASVNN